MFRGRHIQLKSPDQIDAMRAAGLVVADTLAKLSEAVAPGVSTGELDAIAEENIRAAGAVPSFIGYHGFPATICSSVNEQVVHAIPSRAKVLAEGDLISIDCGAILDGWHGDAAITVPVGEVDKSLLRMIEVAEDSMWAGIAAARVGRPADRHLAPGRAHRTVRRPAVRHRRGVRRARHRYRDAPGPARAQLRPAGPWTAAGGRDGAGDRADDHGGLCGWSSWPTAGRW